MKQPEVFYKKDDLKSFNKFTGKHLYQRGLSHSWFPVNLSKFFKNNFFTEHLWATASESVTLAVKININATWSPSNALYNNLMDKSMS